MWGQGTVTLTDEEILWRKFKQRWEWLDRRATLPLLPISIDGQRIEPTSMIDLVLTPLVKRNKENKKLDVPDGLVKRVFGDQCKQPLPLHDGLLLVRWHETDVTPVDQIQDVTLMSALLDGRTPARADMVVCLRIDAKRNPKEEEGANILNVPDFLLALDPAYKEALRTDFGTWVKVFGTTVGWPAYLVFVFKKPNELALVLPGNLAYMIASTYCRLVCPESETGKSTLDENFGL